VWSPRIRGKFSWVRRDVKIVGVKAVPKRIRRSNTKVDISGKK